MNDNEEVVDCFVVRTTNMYDEEYVEFCSSEDDAVAIVAAECDRDSVVGSVYFPCRLFFFA